MENSAELTVCIITFNHVLYIKQAIDSVLEQQTNFKFNILIADDHSTDGTQQILKEYQQKYPDKIELIIQEKNIGPAKNFDILINQPNTNFIAYLDGDDYWIDKNKLQMQFDAFKENVNVGLVYTEVKHFIQENDNFVTVNISHPENQNELIKQLLITKFIEFSSVMFRTIILKKVLKTLKQELEIGAIGDTRIILEFSFCSVIKFIPIPMTVYRMHLGSASRPVKTENFINIITDSYLCRKQFVFRNNLNKKWLSNSVTNTNKGLINKAYKAKNFYENGQLIKNLLISDQVKYGTFKHFKEKITLSILVKLFLSLFCLNLIINKIKK